MNLAQEMPDDWWEVEALFDLCFAPGREALSSYRLRDGVDRIDQLCLTARDDDGNLAAAVRFWPVCVAAVPALLLGPIAVHPTWQGEGAGALLMHGALDRARAMGWKRVLLVGDTPYYGRFGFQHLPDIEMPPPTNPDRVLGLALKRGGWDGISGRVTQDRSRA